MALVTNNISGSSSDSSKIGITGSVIISNRGDAQFPSIGSDAVLFVSGSETAKSVFGGAAKISGSLSTDGNVTLGNSSDDSVTINASTVALPNNLSFDNNTLYIDATNNRVGIGKVPSVTFDVSGTLSTSGADQPSSIFNGDTFISGAFGVSDYFQMKPVGSVRIPTNTTASYIYTSGSTNDLYFTQYSPGFTNTTRLRWLESIMSTGLLHGGILSTAVGSTTFSITSGSGLIVSPNASTMRDPYPTTRLVNFPAYVSQSLTYVATAPITYIGINSSGGIIQQTTPFTNGDFLDYISIGRIFHESSVTRAASTSPSTSYSVPQQLSHFTRAFGALKISGHSLAASSSSGVGTLGLTKTTGESYSEGRNYTFDPDDPNYASTVNDSAVTTSKIYRLYINGSSALVLDTGVGGAGYAVIDPTQYNNNGTLAAAGGQFSIQRVYWFPNSVDRAFYVYYGNALYNSLNAAEAAIASETFTEAVDTKFGAIFVGCVLVRGNATDLTNTSQAKFVQGGLFRSVTSTGGGGVVPTTPGGLDTYVQFNDGGSTFGGDAGLTYDKNTDTLTVAGDVAVNGGDLTTTATTFNLVNSTATTVNLGGGATSAVNIGNSAGTNTVSGQTKFSQGLSGSLTKLTDGTSYLIAGSGISITTGSSGAVTITNDGTVGDITAVTAGTGLTGGGTSGAVTLNIDNSVVATVSGTQFTGPISSTAFTSADRVLITSGTSGVISQAGALIYDSTNQYLGVGVTPSRNVHVANGFRLGSAGSYVEWVGVNSTITRITVGGTQTTLEMNQDTLFPPNKTIGFQSALASAKDSGFSRAAAGIINVSGSAPGALFRFNASSTPLAAGDLGMSTSTGRPQAFIGGSAVALAHTGEVALLAGGNTFTGAQSQSSGNVTLAGGSGDTFTVGNAATTGTAITLGQSTASNTINIGNANTSTGNTQTINIGAGTPAGTGKADITIGNEQGASSLILEAGTGNMLLSGAVTTTYTVGSALGTGTITLGRSTASNTINIGAAQTATGNTQTVNIGTSATGTGKATISIGNTNGATTVAISTGTSGGFSSTGGSFTHSGGSNISIVPASGGSVTLGSTGGAASLTLDSGTGTIGIGTSASSRTINIGTATGVTTGINLGNSAGTSATTVNVGNYGTTPSSTTNIYGDTINIGTTGGSGDVICLASTTASANAKVGIGTNAPSVKLDVISDESAQWAVRVMNDGNNADRYGLYIQCGADNNAGTNYAIAVNDGDGTNQGYVTFSGGTVTYGAFTGDHYARVVETNIEKTYGIIVKVVSTSYDPGRKNVKYVVEQTSTEKDPAAFGVYSADMALCPDESMRDCHSIFCLGDGHVLVTDEGGNIDIGDYICSSNRPGHGMKQDDDLLHSYTVAKSTEAVDFTTVAVDPIRGYKSKLITCTYHSA